MLARLLVIGLIISVLLTCGCVEAPEEGATGSMTEDQALETIEQEMEEAIENIEISEIESSIG